MTPVGAVYTPDWLADHVLDVIGWQPDDDLLDPTCGDGAFLRAAVRRRLAAGARDLVGGLRGIDIDPVAVEAARAAIREMAGAEPDVEVGDALDATAQARFVVGNPPWVRWSALPPAYAARVKALGAVGRDRWVGGIEPDVATVITQHAVRSLLAPGGTLAFVITGTVFANESSEHFRRFAGAKVRARRGLRGGAARSPSVQPPDTARAAQGASRRRIRCRTASTARTASRSCSPRRSPAPTPGRG